MLDRLNSHDSLWSYEDRMDQAHLRTIADVRAHQLARCLCGVAERLNPQHRASAEWLRQVGERVVNESKAIVLHGVHRRAPFEGIQDPLAALLQMIVRPILRAEYLVPLERMMLTQCLEQLEHLIPVANGHANGHTPSEGATHVPRQKLGTILPAPTRTKGGPGSERSESWFDSAHHDPERVKRAEGSKDA